MALAAVVHIFKSIFKIFLVERHAESHTVIRFGVPAIGAAIAGAFLGNRLREKVTMGWIQKIVALMLVGSAVALAAGWI